MPSVVIHVSPELAHRIEQLIVIAEAHAGETLGTQVLVEAIEAYCGAMESELADVYAARFPPSTPTLRVL